LGGGNHRGRGGQGVTLVIYTCQGEALLGHVENGLKTWDLKHETLLLFPGGVFPSSGLPVGKFFDHLLIQG
jgi:hypothetical protein